MNNHTPTEDDTRRVVERIDDLLGEVNRLRHEIDAAEARERRSYFERRRAERRSGRDRRQG